MISNYELMNLCIKNQWFTAGTTTQYDKMFTVAEDGADLDCIVMLIWLCSEEPWTTATIKSTIEAFIASKEPTMTFQAYILEKMAVDGEFDCIIGDVDMPATVCVGDDMPFPTDRMREKYGALLDAKVNVLSDSTVEVLFDDDRLGERFCLDMAGYCSQDEYTQLTGLDC
ncbi:hypothetical protein RFF05_06935 [Bengtsoniella intestinalis]|uniref:hypothetical protein n=1 Tax=Bengtsoniella intestinalis TaxID=3073143 RepID=UPI00391FBB95